MNRLHTALLALALLLAGCGDRARLNIAETIGPAPILPPEVRTPIPTINVARATGWPAGAAPIAAAGLQVQPFATGFEHPRWLRVLPNGDVLVAETAAPPPDPAHQDNSIRAHFFREFQKKAGSAVPSANRITLLRDADGDGVAEIRTPYITGLNSPFGMALVGDTLYVANADALVAFPYDPAATAIAAAPRTIARLPAQRNHHWTKSLVASPDGRRLYVGVGSNSNVAEHGMVEEEGRAAVWEIDPATGAHRIFASGLRNPVGLDFLPGTGRLYAVVNERDELGSDLVPDYLTEVRDGAFYGWPWSYFGRVDTRVEPPRPDMVARSIAPDYALGAHVAALGLAFSAGARLGPAFAHGAFVGEHGSWNRRPYSGYRVVFVPFAGGRPSGQPIDVLWGFLDEENDRAMGRPVGVAIAKDGALLVADDVGNTVWRVSALR
jgi:glucose/arabinose dehydrogenase